jgi:tRNA(Ile)-lysidine synthetase-like protein
MIHIQGTIPKTVYLGFSGGVDSAAVLDFLARRNKVVLVYVNHNDEISQAEEAVVDTLADAYATTSIKFRIREAKPKNQSKEEFWRNERYKAFHSISGEVITCHHLDDCVETWVWNMANGRAATIPYRNKNVFRPFRLNRKSEFISWCERKRVDWFHDYTNDDSSYGTRNYIRNELMPHMLRVNPGIYTTIRNKLLQEKI